MNKHLLLVSAALVASLAFAIPANGQTAPGLANVVSSCGGASYSAGQNRPVTQTTTGNACTSGTATISGTVSENLAQVNAVTVSTGAGATGTGTQRVGVAQDVTTIAGSAPGTAASPSANAVSTVSLPSSASTAAVAPVFSSAVETGHVIKAGTGNLYSLSVTADATLSAAAWAIMAFNSTTVPAAGAVTPAWCILLPAGATAYTGEFTSPMRFSTGISLAVSVGQTCFTKVDSAHAFISANAQ